MEMVLSSSICIFLLIVLVFVLRTRRFLVFFRRQNSRITQLNLIRSISKCPGGGRTPHVKGEGMLFVSLRGVNFGFWSHLGCSWQNAIIFSREGLV